jgi:hypothetical protein
LLRNGSSWRKLPTKDDEAGLAVIDGPGSMLKLSEYLENVRQFERLAADEINPAIKAQFEKQAEAYRKLAERRAEFLRAVKPKISN